MAKRFNGEGTIDRSETGLYRGRLSTGRKINGKYERIAYYSRSRKQLIENITQANQLIRGGYYEKGSISFGAWLDKWLQQRMYRIKPTTASSYEAIIKKAIKPFIGSILLRDLTQVEIQRFLNSMNCTSRSRMVSVYTITKSAIKMAYDRDMIFKDLTIGLELPKSKTPVKTAALTDEQLKLFFEAAVNSPYYDLFVIALDTGMRIGELLALDWSDIDLETGTVDICKNVVYAGNQLYGSENNHGMITQNSLKTKSGRRKIPLTKRALNTFEKMYLARAGEHVFTGKRGKRLQYSIVSVEFSRIRKLAGLPQCGIHIMRHTFITKCFEQNVHTKVISEMVGHSKIDHTMDLYTHVQLEMKREAVAALDQMYTAQRL